MNHHTEAELMPCPFCGSEHVIMEQYKADGLRIICKKCAVKREQRTMRKSLDWLRAGMISDWNRRAPAAPVPQRRLTLDEVEQAVGYHSSAWDCVDPSDLVDAIFNLAAAPQPPEAALVPSIAVTPEMVEAANEAYCPFGDMELALCAALQVAPIPPGAAPVQLPENIREGEPYDNPAFEALARALGVWGTAQSAVCAQFWIAAKEQST